MSGTGFCPGEWFQCNITTSTVKTLPFQYTEELQPLQIYWTKHICLKWRNKISCFLVQEAEQKCTPEPISHSDYTCCKLSDFWLVFGDFIFNDFNTRVHVCMVILVTDLVQRQKIHN